MKSTVLRKLPVLVALVGLLAAPGAMPAGFFYDHSFPDVDWLVLETEHFIIYYYPEVEWTAKMMAKYAEIAYPKVTGLFDFPLKEKIHIVVRDQEDYANGWAAYNLDQITAWATPLYYILRGRQEWIPDMFTHEFAHMVSLKVNDFKSEGALVILGQGLIEDGVHNIDFGGSLVIGRSAPFFWIEGIAEYGTHLSGLNWWTTARDMHQRMSMLEDNFLSYEEMFEVYSRESSFDRERGYQQGYAMGLYVMEKYGKEKYAQLGLNAGKKGHLVWEKSIEEVLGTDGPSLFEGWLKWMKDRYERFAAPIRQQEHLGRELMITSREEEVDLVEKLPDGRVKVEIGRRHYQDPVPEDQEEAKAIEEARKKEKPKYQYWDKQKRKQHFEKAGQFIFDPRISPDGKYTAYIHRKGISLIPMRQEEWPLFSGRYLSQKKNEQVTEDTKNIEYASYEGGYDFSPDSQKVIFSSMQCPDTWLPCINLDGYYRTDLFEYHLENEDSERLTRRLRAKFPSYSPDGQTIAFVHFEDGQNHLGLMPAQAREVSPEGKCVVDGRDADQCIKWLIKKHDGTLLGAPRWSPDGSQIVIDLYRNRQQDIWIINTDGSGLRPLTWDKAEDRDGQFTPDGKHILFVSDRTGVFNVYRLSLNTGELKQLTNVLGGAFTPHLTKPGDLLYAYFTSYGLKIYGHKQEDFYNQTVDAGYPATPQEVARNLAYQEPLPEIKEKSDSYNPFHPKNWAPPVGAPLFIYERKGIQVGAVAWLTDALDKHTLSAEILLGQQAVYLLSYQNRFWYPTFEIAWAHINAAYEFAQGYPYSAATQEANQSLESIFWNPINYKVRNIYDLGWASVGYDFSSRFTSEARYTYRHIYSERATGTRDEAYLTNNSYQLTLHYSDFDPYLYVGEGDINPRGGRNVVLDYVFVRSGLPTEAWADVEWLGRKNPPGDHSDDYTFHELQLGYTEYLPISWWNPNGKHTLELHLRAGWQNRNVHRFDEFFAGSMHPLRWVPYHSTTQEFAGYEDFTLGGETMLIFGIAYRFPLLRHIDRKAGPFYFVSLWGEFFGTMGNLWGFTADFVRDKYGNIERNPKSYWDPAVKRGSIRRERPFFDIASKNGNYLLYDIGFTLKLKAFIFGTTDWNSFFRVAYGLNDIIGQFEMNDDYYFVDAYPNNALYAESEPKSLRISIGVGTRF